MKVLGYQAEKGYEEKTGAILGKLERLVCEHKYLVPNGWRCIVRMQRYEGLHPYYYHLDVQSDRGGGSWAEAKMHTVETLEGCGATFPMSIKELCDVLEDCYESDFADEFSKCENVASLSKEQMARLVDCENGPGIAPGYGGIAVPYDRLIVKEDRAMSEKGEIRVAFSGASQEQDLFFALIVFRTLRGLFMGEHCWIDLGELEKIPPIKFWLDLLQIKEA